MSREVQGILSSRVVGLSAVIMPFVGGRKSLQLLVSISSGTPAFIG